MPVVGSSAMSSLASAVKPALGDASPLIASFVAVKPAVGNALGALALCHCSRALSCCADSTCRGSLDVSRSSDSERILHWANGVFNFAQRQMTHPTPHSLFPRSGASIR